MHITLRFFASVREALDVSHEALTLPADVTTVGGVRSLLTARGGPPGWPFSDELGPDATVISWNFFKNYQR